MPSPHRAGSVAAVLCLLPLMACDRATAPVLEDTAIRLASHPGLVLEAETLQLHAVVSDARGAPRPGAIVTYTSRDPALASVTPDGVVTGVLTGSTYIVAESGPARDSTHVTVLVRRDGFSGRPYGAAITPDGLAFVTVIGPEEIAVARSPFPRFTTAASVGAVPTDVQFDSRGARAYITNQFSQSVAVVDVATGAWIDTIPVVGDPFKLLVAPGDSILWVTTNANSVFAIRLATGEVAAHIPTIQDANGLAARGSKVWISTHWGGTVMEVNAYTFAVEREFDVGGVPQELVLDPDGDRLFIANEDGRVQIWSLERGAELASIALPGGGGFGMARNPANGFLYVSTGYYSHTVWVVDPRRAAIVRRIRTGGTPRRIAFDHGAQIGIVTNEYGWVDLIH